MGWTHFIKYSFEKLRLWEIRTIWVKKGWYLWNVKQMQRCRKLNQWYLVFSYIKLIEIPVSALCLNCLNERVCLLMFALFASPGSSKSWVSCWHEAGGCRSDGASPGVCGHSDAHYPPASEDTLWWVGRWIWSVGGLWVPRPVSRGMVSADWVPAPASSTAVWVLLCQ